MPSMSCVCQKDIYLGDEDEDVTINVFHITNNSSNNIEAHKGQDDLI